MIMWIKLSINEMVWVVGLEKRRVGGRKEEVDLDLNLLVEHLPKLLQRWQTFFKKRLS